MDLKFLGDCRNEDLIRKIFGSVTEFSHEVEENGNEFTYHDGQNFIVIEYDEKKDIHSFYLEE